MWVPEKAVSLELNGHKRKGDHEYRLSLKIFGNEAGRKMIDKGGEEGNQGTYAWISVQQQSK